MIKIKWTTGRPIFCIKVEHYVDASVFADALRCHYYRNSLDFPDSLTRKEAKKILLDELCNHGDFGEIDTTLYEGASLEVTEPMYELYKQAKEWVEKNYPYLKYEPSTI